MQETKQLNLKNIFAMQLRAFSIDKSQISRATATALLKDFGFGDEEVNGALERLRELLKEDRPTFF